MSLSDKICTDSCKNSDDAYDVNDMLQNMSTVDNEVNDISVCANCGKEGANNVCNKCKQVKYCNAVCKKVHKKKHKKQCEEYIKLATEKHNEELRIAAELHDKKLFRQPPPKEDCPICFLRMPSLASGSIYYACCGKEICSGCVHAPVYDDQGNEVDNRKCPFCRTPHPTTDEELINRYKRRMKTGDQIAIYNLGCDYFTGSCGYPQNHMKALELWHRAAELGYAKAHCSIGNAYYNGEGVEVDKEKATYYYELAAMKGSVFARSNLGIIEHRSGNMDRALRHYMIAVRSGYSKSLEEIQDLYSDGHATKEDYAKALQLYQGYLGEIKSAQRDKAAAANERYRYY